MRCDVCNCFVDGCFPLFVCGETWYVCDVCVPAYQVQQAEVYR